MTLQALAEALRTGAAAPEGQDAGAWRTARAVLLEETSAQAAEAFPQPLLAALLEALVVERRVGPLEALAASATKATAKAARHAQYRLRSAGVETRAPEAPRPPPAPPPEPPEELPSLLSPPDGAGEFLLLLARPVRGGLALHELVLSDEVGLVGHVEAETSRSAWRRSLREARTGLLKEVSLETARGLLSEALRRNVATHSPFPKGAEAMLRRLQVSPATQPPEDLPLPEAGDATLALEAARLHEEPELRGWLPPEDELKVLAARVQEVETSPLALSPAQRSALLLERVQAMARDFFTEERARLYARRLWLMADVFAGTHRAEAAQLARAEARRLYHQAPGVFSRFAEALYGKLIRPGPPPEDAPTEATPAANPGAPTERRSKGGLILP